MLEDKKQKDQNKKKKNQQILKHADDFIRDLEAKIQPISLRFLPPNINYSTSEQQSLYPFNINTQDPKYYQNPSVDQEMQVQFLKDLKQYKKAFIQFQCEREVRSTQNNKKIDQRLKILQDRWKDNSQKRQINLTQNSLSSHKFMRNINIEEYKSIIVQTFTQWIGIKTKVTQQIDELKKIPLIKQNFFFKLFQPFKKAQQVLNPPQVLTRISNIVELSFLLKENWHLGQNYQVRIICIHNDPQIQYGHFYIYTKQHPAYLSLLNRDPLTPITAENLKRKIIFSYFASKHKKKAAQLNKLYLQNTKTNLSNNLIFNNLKQQFLIPLTKPIQIINLKSQQRIYSDYPRQNIQNFIQAWKDKANFYNKNSKTFVYIQPKFIQIPKNHLAKNVKLIINNLASQNLVFVGQNQKSFVFEPISLKNYAYDLQKFHDSTAIFKATIQDQNGSIVQFKNNIPVSHLENQALGYSYEIGLIPENPNLILNNYKNDFPYILAFQAVFRKASQFQTPENITAFRQINLLTKIGKIPNIYCSYYYYNYTPQIHPLVSEIVTGGQCGINQKNFQTTYLQFVSFFQKQQNKSQNYCQYLKLKKARSFQYSGFVIKDRYKRYCQLLKQNLSKIKVQYNDIFKAPVKISKYLNKKQIANLYDDIKNCQLYNAAKIKQILERYIVFQYLTKKDLKIPKKYGTNFSMIKIADLLIQIFHRDQQYGVKNSNTSINELTIFFITFIQTLYPYQSNIKSLQQDLTYLRILAQKFIPQFNYLLNRKGIGLENYASQLLLKLFTTLPMQLCYRIWDHMICNLNKLQHMRLITVYTLMLYQEKSSLLPIYPINQIIQSIYINSSKIKLDTSAFYNMSKLIQNNKADIVQRQNKISQLAKIKYLRRFIFGVHNKSQMLDEDDIFRPTDQLNDNLKTQAQVNQRVHTKLVSLKQINYPLPTPGYQGFPITKVYLFIGGIFLLNNLNLHSKQYKLQINLVNGTSLIEIPIKDKSSFINRFIQFQFNANSLKKTKTILQFRLVQKPKTELLCTKLGLNGFHKDIIYRENLTLNKSKRVKDYQLNNLGTSVINFSIIIKSLNQNHQLDNSQEKMSRQAQYLQKLLDYDIQPQNNESVKAATKLDKKFKKIMDPLDQLNVQKYLRLKVSTSFYSNTPQWIKISNVSIEQLKAIFSYVFSDESQKSIRLNFPKFYESYAENYQKFSMGQFLMNLILMSEITKLKKLSMLYCIAVHYQNVSQSTPSQQMTVQTLNSIIKLVMRTTGFINACPYAQQLCGQILYGCYYEKGNKVEQNKKQITQILQDWVYICQLKSGYRGIILGSVQGLYVLQSMLPAYILNQIQKQKLCRFEIQYKVGGQIYIWSATVNTVDFSIKKRGIKFLNNYPKYQDSPQYLTSVAQLMYNCQNLISLQTNTTIDYQQFVNIFRNSSLLDYLLTYNQYLIEKSQSKDKTSYINYQLKKAPVVQRNLSASQRNILLNNQQFYTDFALFRCQNCIPTWQRCKVINDQGKTLVSVSFMNKQGQYFIPRYQIICLDQIQIIETKNRMFQMSQSVISNTNRIK